MDIGIIEKRLLNDCLASSTLRMNENCRKLESEGKKVYHTGFGESPFPIPDSIVSELKKNAEKNMYLPVKGIVDLRKLTSSWMKKNFDVDFLSENIIFGSGSKALIGYVIASLDCQVILPTPCWVSYVGMCIFYNRKYEFIHTKYENRWNVTPNDLRKICEKNPKKLRLLVLTYPNNPCGTTYTEKEFKELAKVCKEFNVVVLADEIYGLFYNENCSPISFAKYYDYTIVTSGLSKIVGAGGWRVGFVCIPEKLGFLTKVICSICSCTISCCAAPQQFASMKCFSENKDVESYLKDCRKVLTKVYEMVYNILKDTELITCQTEGGFYMYIVFDNYREELLKKYKVKTAGDLCDILMKETGIAVIDSSKFGRDESELGFRFCLTSWRKKGRESLENVKKMKVDDEYVKKYCYPMIEATEALADFANSLKKKS